MWIDSHCHLFDATDEEIVQYINECHALDVHQILNIGTDLLTSEKVIQQAEQFSSNDLVVSAAAGISAADVEKYCNDLSWEESLRSLLKSDSVVALGEIGIDGINDYYAPFEMQLDFFRKQLAIAKDMSLPVIVHSRGVEAQALSEVQLSGVENAIFHCFTGSESVAKEISNAGYYVSFSGIVTFKRSDFDQVIKAVDPAKLLIETDSPYLAPVPKRGKKNQPAWVSYVGGYVADVLRVTPKLLAQRVSGNFSSFISR